MFWAKKLQDQKQEHEESLKDSKASKENVDYVYSEEEGVVYKDEEKRC